MNTVSWAALAILLVSIVIGIIRGLVKTLFSTFSVVIILVAASVLGPKLGDVVSASFIGDSLRTQIESTLFEGDGLWSSEADEDGTGTALADEPDTDSEGDDGLTGDLTQLGLPSIIIDALEKNNTAQNYAELGVTQLKEYVSAYLAGMIIRAACFVLVAIATAILLLILVTALDLISKLPVLKTMNRAAGGVFGAVRGYAILWVLCIGVTALSSTPLGSELYAQINESLLLRLLYNHNYLMTFITQLF